MAFPHTFLDGVEQTASGVQVMDNLNYLLGLITNLEGRALLNTGTWGARTARNVSTAYTPNATRDTEVLLELGCLANTGMVAPLYVGGKLVSETDLAGISSGTSIVKFSFLCPPKTAWEIGAGNFGIASLFSTYREF